MRYIETIMRQTVITMFPPLKYDALFQVFFTIRSIKIEKYIVAVINRTHPKIKTLIFIISIHKLSNIGNCI